MLDDLGADDRALAEDDLEDLGGQSGLDEQVTGPERGERGLRVGLHDDGVARDEGGERVADGELQRVVPGRDLADDPARLAQLGDLGEGRDDTGVVTGAQVGGGLATVVAGGDGDRLHLLVGVQACLAGLQLDEVEDLGLPLEDEVVEAQQDGGAGLDRGGGPDGLGGARAGEGLGDVLGGGLGQVRQLRPGEGGVVGGAAGADDAAGEPGDHVGRHDVGGGAGAGGRGRDRVGGRGGRGNSGLRGGGVGNRGGGGGLRVRHEGERRRRSALWVPVGNAFSPGTHIAPAITGT